MIKSRQLNSFLILLFFLTTFSYCQDDILNFMKFIDTSFVKKGSTSLQPQEIKLENLKIIKSEVINMFTNDTTKVYKIEEDIKVTSIKNLKSQIIIIKDKKDVFYLRINRYHKAELFFHGIKKKNKENQFYFYCRSKLRSCYLRIKHTKKDFILNTIDTGNRLFDKLTQEGLHKHPLL